MKYTMIVEEEDLKDFVKKFLSLHGVAPRGGDIVFRDGEGTAIEGLHVTLDCEMAPTPERCPLCYTPMRSEGHGTVMLEKRTPKESASVRMYDAGGSEEPVHIDESLGESTVPPGEEDVASDDAGGGVMSMAAIQAANKRLLSEGKRTKKRSYLAGESDKPPEPGE